MDTTRHSCSSRTHARSREEGDGFSTDIHLEQVGNDAPSVEGSAIALARTLIDLGEADALLADERKIRACAEEEHVETVGSIWLFSRLYEVDAIDFETAKNTVHLARERGYRYSNRLMSEFSHVLISSAKP